MRRAKRLTVYAPFLALAAFVGVTAASGQDVSADGRVTITGRVVDAVTRSPLEGVIVDIEELSLEVRTDSTGQFEIRDIPLGTYELGLSLEGYERASGDLEIARSGFFVATLTPLGRSGETSPGRLVGRIVEADSDTPLVGAEVRLPELSLGAVAEADGRFTIVNVPPGRHRVEFSHLGYATVRDTISVEPDRTSDVRVQLAVDPVNLEAIEVTVEHREIALETAGFYERREKGWGRFIDLEDIERQNPHELSDLLDGLNGVNLVHDCSNALGRYVVLRSGRASGCYPSRGLCFPLVVMDGTIVHRPGIHPARVDDLVSSSAIAGIEVYPSSAGVPIEYYHSSSCGVILIWTRR